MEILCIANVRAKTPVVIQHFYNNCINVLGLSTCHFAWAFHSEAEEELINMIPAIQKGDPQWSELRAMGIGWWVRNINTLRRCIEKVGIFLLLTLYLVLKYVIL